MGSVTANLDMITEISNTLAAHPNIIRLGPAPISTKEDGQLWRLMFKYPYSDGVAIAKLLKLEAARVAAGRTRVSSTGRGARAITVKMNDAEVV
jgi:hypothetical protein